MIAKIEKWQNKLIGLTRWTLATGVMVFVVNSLLIAVTVLEENYSSTVKFVALISIVIDLLFLLLYLCERGAYVYMQDYKSKKIQELMRKYSYWSDKLK